MQTVMWSIVLKVIFIVSVFASYFTYDTGALGLILSLIHI